jgi:hypothetical protein
METSMTKSNDFLRSSVKTVGVKSLVDFLWQEFCELPDRSSPEDYPDMALVSLPELTAIIETYLERSAIEAPAAASEVTEDWIRDTAMNVMLATEVEEAIRILTAALKGDRS